jgi:hypothetical protein
MANVSPDELRFEAGTTRKTQLDCRGGAFAGLEIDDLRRVKVRLTNTFCTAFHCRGAGFHVPMRPNSRNFAGFVIDYHTPDGYTKRVRLATGVLHPKCSSVEPDYGKAGLADVAIELGSELIESPEAIVSLDLEQYAPEGWDGRVWLSVGNDWVAPDRRLAVEILAVNDDVTGPFLAGTDPRAFKEAYDKPKTLAARRSPGGIIIDGRPDEEMWREAAKTERFFLHGGQGASNADTEAMILYDDEYLYVGFICQEPDRDKPRILGGAIWDDDEIEIWIDTNSDGETFKQVIVNAANEMMELSEGGTETIGSDSATYVHQDGTWMVEMRIPFTGLGVEPPKPGDQWRLSLCRYRPPGDDFGSELIVWAPLQRGGFKDLANFGTLVFE